jgi:hypothetical protein
VIAMSLKTTIGANEYVIPIFNIAILCSLTLNEYKKNLSIYKSQPKQGKVLGDGAFSEHDHVTQGLDKRGIQTQ